MNHMIKSPIPKFFGRPFGGVKLCHWCHLTLKMTNLRLGVSKVSFCHFDFKILIAKTMFFKLDYVLMVDQTHSQNQGYLISQNFSNFDCDQNLRSLGKTRILKRMIMKNKTLALKSYLKPTNLIGLNGTTAWSCDRLKILSFYLKVFFECSCGRLASFLAHFW